MKVEHYSVAKVRFTARWGERADLTEFALGEGPCGKTVLNLTVGMDGQTLHISQRHTDGTVKDFHYMRSDIDGRIEVERSCL